MNRFIFADDIPDAIAGLIKEPLEKLDWLLPLWCQRCNVDYIDHNEDSDMRNGALASCVCYYEYRVLRLYIYPRFVSQDAARQSEVLTHELIHGHVNQLFNFAHAELNRLVPAEESPAHNGTLIEQLREHCESTTQDLTIAILRLLKEKG
ncbi:hypothetical protein EON83_12550 [bacterium]|nr:MAG: hypothetical protein EON83_12550 [bacterium]